MSLKEVYQPYFKIGAAVGENAFGRPAALYRKNFWMKKRTEGILANMTEILR